MKIKIDVAAKNPGEVSAAITKFINPAKIVEALNFQPGMKVADFGCGTGYFVIPLAKAVGNKGEIYAIDIVPEKLESVKSQIRLAGVHNVIVKRANLEESNGSGLSKESVDWVIIVNMLYENGDKNSILEETKRVLKKGAHALVIEWKPKAFPIGPDKKLRLEPETLRTLAQKSGLGVERELPVSDFHYGVILTKYK